MDYFLEQDINNVQKYENPANAPPEVRPIEDFWNYEICRVQGLASHNSNK